MVYEKQLKMGLYQGGKVIDKHTTQLYVLAENCNQPGYVKLMKGLCIGHGVNFFNDLWCRDSWVVGQIMQD